MTRQSWMFLGGIAAMIVLAFAGFVVVAAVWGFDTDDRMASGPDCSRVSSSKVDAITAGLDDGLSLGTARAVRSGDYEEVWMIAVEIDGPGLEDRGDVGVWASNSTSGAGPIFAVDGMAREFSDWGAFGSVTDDGVSAARGCVD